MSFTAQITADVSGFSAGIDKAAKEIDGLQKTIESKLGGIGKSLESFGKKASILSAAIVAAGGAAFKMAADLEDAIGATNQIFKESSKSVKDWASGLKSDYGVAKKEALEYSNLMGTMLKEIGGLTIEEAAKQASALVELAGDLTAMFGGNVSEAVTALTGSLRGVNVMLGRYGVAVNDVLIKTRAFEMGILSAGQEMTPAIKQAATLSLIYEQTGAAQGQAAREANSASGAMRSLRTEITNLATEMGEVLLPIITPIVAKIRDFVAALRAMSPEMQSIVVGIAGIATAAGPVLVILGKVLQMLPAIKISIAALSGPVGIIVAAIAGAAMLIIKNWDAIKAYFTTGGGAEVFNTIKGLVLDVKYTIVESFNLVKTAIAYIWDSIGDDIKRIFGNSIDTVVTMINTIAKTFRNVAQVLEGIFTLDFKRALEGLKNLFMDIFNGIKNIIFNTVSSVSSALAGLLDLIGMDKWAEGLRSFSEKMKPSMDQVTEAAKEQAVVVEELTTKVTNLGNAFGKASKDGSNIYELVRKTSDELTVLNNRIEGLRDGSVIVKNVAAELEKCTKEAGELSKKLDLLTGNRNININANIDSALKTWLDSSTFEGISPVITPKIDISQVQAGMGQLIDDAKVLSLEIENMVGSAITQMMQGIGSALANGENIINAIGKSLLSAMGNLAQQLGAQMIAFGVAGIALKKLMMNPYTAIAAGAALVALGAAASAAASKTVSSHTGGGYTGGTSSYSNVTSPGASEYRGQWDDDFNVEFVIKGDALVGVLNTAQQRRDRT